MSFRLSKGDQRMAGLLEEEGDKLKWWYFSSFRKIERKAGCGMEVPLQLVGSWRQTRGAVKTRTRRCTPSHPRTSSFRLGCHGYDDSKLWLVTFAQGVWRSSLGPPSVGSEGRKARRQWI